jgi:capsular polysaccharide biosynthesis protein
MEQVIRNLGLDETYGSLSSRVSTSNPSNSRILEITVTDPDPEQAKLIADELAEVASKYISEKMDQDPPTIIQNGYADGSAVSPNIQKNTLIGALLGFFMAAAIVVISYLLNDSVLTAEDVERKLGLNLLGTLPEEEAEDDGEKKKKKKSKKPKTTTNKKTA